MDSDIVEVVSELPRELRDCQKKESKDVLDEGVMINQYVQGQICGKFPVFGTNRKKRMKIILEDNMGKINVFLRREYADVGNASFSIGDTLYIADALIEKSPHFPYDHVNTRHIIVGGIDAQPRVWVCPQRENQQETSDADGQQRQQNEQQSGNNSAPGTPGRVVATNKSPKKKVCPQAARINTPDNKNRRDQQPCTLGQITPLDSPSTSTRSRSGHESGRKSQSKTVSEANQQPQQTATNSVAAKTQSKTASKTNQQPQQTAPNSIATKTQSKTVNETNQQPQQTATNKEATRTQSKTASQSNAKTNSSTQKSQNTAAADTSPATTSSNQQENSDAAGGQQNEQQSGNNSAPGTPGRVVATNKSPKKKPNYLYTKISDLQLTGSVNIYGVVKFFKPPRKTRGPDYMMALTLVDESLVNPNDADIDIGGLKCNLFQRDQRSLPQVLSVGDIVRLHRIKVSGYNNQLQAMRGSGGFSSLVFDGRIGSPMKPRSSTPEYTITQDDKDRVAELRKWAHSMRNANTDLNNPSQTLDKVFIGQYFDLTCQVVAKAVLESESCVLIKVWDGRKCPWEVREIDTGEVGFEWDDIAAFKAEGLTVDICLYDDHVPAGKKIKPGDYIRLYNLHALKYNPPDEAPDNPVPMGEFCLHRGTAYGRGVIVMSQYDPDVKELIKMLDNVNLVGTQSNQNQSADNPGPSTSHASDHHGDPPSSFPVNTGTASSSTALSTATRRLEFVSDQRNAARTKQSGPSTNQRVGVGTDEPGPSTNQRVGAETDTNQRSSARKDKTRPSRRNNASSHCMLRSASNHVHIKISSIAEVKLHKEPYLFRVRARVADFLPNNIEEFVVLYCPKCQLRLKVPSQQTSNNSSEESDVGGKQQDLESQSRNLRRSRRKRLAPSDTNKTSAETTLSKRKSPRKQSDTTSSQQSNADESIRKVAVVRPSNMARKTRAAKRTINGRKTTAELDVNPSQPEESGSVRVTITMEDLTVQDALLMAHQGVKLQIYPMGTSSPGRSGAGKSGTESACKLFYVCPNCIPQSSSDSTDTDDTASIFEYKYCVKLCLDDGSDRIEVVLIDKHAETFFEDVPPVNLHENLESKFTLEDYMKTLCPYTLPPSQPTMSPNSSDHPHPWLDACIMSYDVMVAGQRVMKYRMFHTALALDVE